MTSDVTSWLCSPIRPGKFLDFHFRTAYGHELAVRLELLSADPCISVSIENSGDQGFTIYLNR